MTSFRQIGQAAFFALVVAITAGAKGDGPTTQPAPDAASGPSKKAAATQPSPAELIGAFDVKCRNPEDRLEIAAAGGHAVFTLTSPSGMGTAAIDRKGDNWGGPLVVRFHLYDLQSLTVSCGEISISAFVRRDDGGSAQHFVVDGEEGPMLSKDSPYWLGVRILDGSFKPVTALGPDGGYFEITVPRALLDDKARTVLLSWIDDYPSGAGGSLFRNIFRHHRR